MGRTNERRLRIEELHALLAAARLPSLGEVIRLIESDRFEALTARHICDVGNYRAIELGDERFFHRAFTAGKEAAASLVFARDLGRDLVLGDLRRLRASLGVEAASAPTTRGDPPG